MHYFPIKLPRPSWKSMTSIHRYNITHNFYHDNFLFYFLPNFVHWPKFFGHHESKQSYTNVGPLPLSRFIFGTICLDMRLLVLPLPMLTLQTFFLHIGIFLNKLFLWTYSSSPFNMDLCYKPITSEKKSIYSFIWVNIVTCIIGHSMNNLSLYIK